MISKFQTSARSEAACIELIRRLRFQVVVHGDASAALALLTIATSATVALHSTWTDPRPRQIGVPEEKSPVPSLAARREILAYYLGAADPLPAFSWKDRRYSDPRQKEAIDGFRSGPFKPRRRKDIMMNRLLRAALSLFQEVRLEHAQPRGLNGEIWRLPRLDLKSRGQWADVIVKWLWSTIPHAFRDENSDWYKLAKPERKLRNKKQKAESRHEGARRRWKAQGRIDDDRLSQWGGARCARFGWMDEVMQAEDDRRSKRERGMSVTDRHIVDGLREQIIEYFGRNLRS
jgi:hypothetical protein